MNNNPAAPLSNQVSAQAEESFNNLASADTTGDKSKKTQKPLLFLIIITVVAVVVVLWGINTLGSSQQSPDLSSSEVSNSEGLTQDVAVEEVDTSNWQAYQNNAYSYSILYPPGFKLFSNSADAGNAPVTAESRSFFIAQEEDKEPYVNRYLDFEVFQLRPSFGTSLTETSIEIGNFSGWKYQSNGPDAPFSTYVIQLGEQYGYLQTLVSNDPEKKVLGMQILNSLFWASEATSSDEMTVASDSFQQLLAEFCYPLAKDDENSDYKLFRIDQNDLPVEFSDALEQKYGISTHLVCEAGGTAFATAREAGSAFISAETQNEKHAGTLYIGDSASSNGGMRTPQLSVEAQDAAYYAYDSRSPYVVTSPNGLKTIVSLIAPSPYCPRESTPLTMEFLTYRELGELRLLVSRELQYPLDDEMRALFIQFADPVGVPDDGGIYTGQYQLCDQTEFETALFSKYLSNYAATAPEFKAVIDENSTDIMGVSLKNE